MVHIRGEDWRMRKNKIIVFLCILASGLLVTLRGGTGSYVLFYMCLGIPIMAWAYLIFVYFRFRIYQNIDTKRMVKEERIPYYFQLANEDCITYTNVKVVFQEENSSVESLSSHTSYCLVPGESIQRSTTIRCHYRGDYVVGIDQVIVTDFLNLFTFTYSCDSRIHVEVAPRIVPLRQLIIAKDEEEFKNTRQSTGRDATTADIEIRNYAPGDSPRKIHWKASARQRLLLTRKDMEEPKRKSTIVLDLTAIEQEELRYIVEDKLIEATLAITHYYYEKRKPIYICYEQDKMQYSCIASKDEFDSFYEQCSRMHFTSSVSVGALVEQCGRYDQGNRSLFVLTGLYTDELYRSCYGALQQGNDVSIVYVGTRIPMEIIHKVDQRIPIYQIGLQQEVVDVLEGSVQNGV